MQHTAHKPVLLDEVLEAFRQGIGEDRTEVFILDCTLGGGGHAAALLSALPTAFLVGFDRDARAVERARMRLAPFAERMFLVNEEFGSAMNAIATSEQEIRNRFCATRESLTFDFILADLGLSSDQLGDAARGFSFLQTGPLDMRMGVGAPRSARQVLNDYSPADLRRVFLRGGLTSKEASKLVAELIRRRPLETTTEFAAACEAVIPRFKQGERRHHPATVPFQAVRIEVNNELESIEGLLADVPTLLAPGGRFAVISFQSLEDRLVTRAMRRWSRPGSEPRHLPVRTGTPSFGRLLTPDAVRPRAQEEEENSRARSARLRVFERRRGGSHVVG